MTMAVYMLGFNTYMGFGEKMSEELKVSRDNILKEIYEYAKMMK